MRIVRRVGFILFFLQGLTACSQSIVTGDSIVVLKIMGDKICIDKKGNLNFSYYYQNFSSDDIILLDYYDPCHWENPVLKGSSDSLPTLGLALTIKNELGEEVFPIPPAQLKDSLGPEKYTLDSTVFFEAHEIMKKNEFEFHTRVLKSKSSLINFFSLKLNKRKCFPFNEFMFVEGKKYTISLYYWTSHNMVDLVDLSVLHKQDKAFVGKVVSNEVELCFEKSKKKMGDQ